MASGLGRQVAKNARRVLVVEPWQTRELLTTLQYVRAGIIKRSKRELMELVDGL